MAAELLSEFQVYDTGWRIISGTEPLYFRDYGEAQACAEALVTSGQQQSVDISSFRVTAAAIQWRRYSAEKGWFVP